MSESEGDLTEFRLAAERFCALVERAGSPFSPRAPVRAGGSPARGVCDRAPAPDRFSTNDTPDDVRPDPQNVYPHLLSALGHDDEHFWRYVNLDLEESERIYAGVLADYLRDIYDTLKEGLDLIALGAEDEAVFEWRTMWFHWAHQVAHSLLWVHECLAAQGRVDLATYGASPFPEPPPDA